MNRLIQFLFRYRTFLVFVLLEGISLLLLIKSNSYHSAEFFTSSNRMAASILDASNYTKGYFSLSEQNRILAEENANLRQLLASVDSTKLLNSDSTLNGLSARVVDNSVFFRNNFLTVNKGRKDGVNEKMGVIGPNGIVGQVKHVSEKYSTVISVLNSRLMVSAKHANSDGLCTVTWGGKDPKYADIMYFPRHILLTAGDSIITSGFNTVFPEGQLVGIVDKVSLPDAATFYEARVKLATDFFRLRHVYLISLPDKNEIDSLVNRSIE